MNLTESKLRKIIREELINEASPYSKLTNKEIALVFHVINKYGQKGQPLASKQTMSYFPPDYVKKVLTDKRVQKAINAQGQKYIDSILKKLN